MNRLHLDQDIHSLSEFRAGVASYVQQVHETHRPVVITLRGKSAAVLLDVADYESLLAKLELIQDVRTAEKQLEGGEGIGHETARRKLLARFK